MRCKLALQLTAQLLILLVLCLLSLSLLSLRLLGLLGFLLQLFEPLQQLPVGCPLLVAVQAVTAAGTQLFSNLVAFCARGNRSAYVSLVIVGQQPVPGTSLKLLHVSR